MTNPLVFKAYPSFAGLISTPIRAPWGRASTRRITKIIGRRDLLRESARKTPKNLVGAIDDEAAVLPDVVAVRAMRRVASGIAEMVARRPLVHMDT